MGRPKKGVLPQKPIKEKKVSKNVETESINAKLRKMFGRDDVVLTGAEMVDLEPEVISISPEFDSGTGGGILVGTTVTLAGETGCGKTSLALKMAAKWQATGRKVHWLAVEPRLYRRDLTGVHGLDHETIEFVKSTKGKILNAQDFLEGAEGIMKDCTDTMLIIDSISMLCDATEMVAQGKKGVPPATVARLANSFFRKVAQYLPVNNNILVVIAHVYADIGNKYNQWAVSLPSKALYSRGTGLLCKRIESWNLGEKDDGVKIGQKIHWTVQRSLLPGCKPKFVNLLRYGYGIDDLSEMIELAKPIALITQAGSWMSLSFLGKDCPKYQGVEKVREHLAENPEHAKLLYSKIMELIL